MEVRPGYKQTEAGVIPEDWDAPELGDAHVLALGLAIEARDGPLPAPKLG